MSSRRPGGRDRARSKRNMLRAGKQAGMEKIRFYCGGQISGPRQKKET